MCWRKVKTRWSLDLRARPVVLPAAYGIDLADDTRELRAPGILVRHGADQSDLEVAGTADVLALPAGTE